MTRVAKTLTGAAFLLLTACGGGTRAPRPSPTAAAAPSASASTSAPASQGLAPSASAPASQGLAPSPRERCEVACLRATCDVGRNCRSACGDVASRARRKGESYEDAFERAARGFLSGDPQACGNNQSAARVIGSGFLQQAYESNPRRSRGFGGSCPDPDVRTDVTKIALERTVCYGSCPIYSLELRSDGTVEYVGVAHVERAGRHRGRISEGWFQGLAELALDIGYFELDDSYSCMVTDNPTVYVAVTRAGRRKIIRHYAPGMTGPPRLTAFEETIDTVVDYVTWDDEKR